MHVDNVNVDIAFNNTADVDKLKLEEKRIKLRNKIIKKMKEYPLEKLSGQDKDTYRQIHEKAKNEQLIKYRKYLSTRGCSIIDKYFANGTDIIPEKIDPQIIPVRTAHEWDIFKTARFTWSLPYSFGYGRRLCFLIMDKSNKKLMGILGCHSPALGLTSRNEYLNLKGKNKVYKLNETLDIFTLGAIPPYNKLLAGKLVAMSVVSNEVREFYKEKYSGKQTEMEGNIISPNLVLLTTTSAYGKSSIYNRVKYKDKLLCFSLGYTKGVGTFKYTDEICSLMKEYLKLSGIEVVSGFGNGPNYKFRLINRAIQQIKSEVNLKSRFKVDNINKLLHHEIQREVYLFPLIKNLTNYMSGLENQAIYYDYSFSDLAKFWKENCLKKRISENKEWSGWKQNEEEWKNWNKNKIKESLHINTTL